MRDNDAKTLVKRGTRNKCVLLLAMACAWLGLAAADTPPPPSAADKALPASREELKKALLFYEDCETTTSRNAEKGVRICGATVAEGRVGKGLLLERREGNRLLNGDFASMDKWLAIGQPVHLKEGGCRDAGCVRITENDYLRQVVMDLPVDEWCCLSVYAKSDTPDTRLEVRLGRNEAKEFPLTAEYARLVFPCRATFQNSTFTLRARGPGAVVVDGAQLETRKTFPSTFTTAQVRPTVPQIQVDVKASGFNPNAGSIALWLKPEWSREYSSGQTIFAWGDAKNPGVDAVSLSAHPRGENADPDWPNRILFSRRREKGSGDGVKSFPLCEWTPSTWHHAVATWKVSTDGRGQMALYLDGKLVGERQFPWGDTKEPNTLSVGYWWGAYADAVLDEIYFFKRPVTAAEAELLFKLETTL